MQLIQPNVVGNFLQSYSMAQDRKREQEEAQYNRQRQMRLDDRADQQFALDMDARQLDMALKRASAMENILAGVDERDPGTLEVAKQRYITTFGGSPQDVASITMADIPRIKMQTGQLAQELNAQLIRARIGTEQAQGRAADALAAGRRAAASPTAATAAPTLGQTATNVPTASLRTPQVRTKPLSTTEINKLLETRRQILDQSEVIKQLQQLKDLSKNAAGGPIGAFVEPLLAPYESVVQKNAPEVLEFLNRSPTRGSDTVVFQNTAQRLALNMLRTTFGGNPTEGEREILMQIQGSASMDPESRARVFEEAIAAAERRQQLFQQQEQAITTGNYAAPPLDQSTTPQTAPVAAPLPTAQRPAPVPAPRQVPRVAPPPGFKVLD